MAQNETPKTTAVTPDSRINLIEAIKTPLAFFTLVVLVVEAIMGLTIGITSGLDKSMIIVGMIALIFLLVSIVAFMAVKNPASLYKNTTKNFTQQTLQQEKPIPAVGCEEYKILCNTYDERKNWGKVQLYAEACLKSDRKDPTGWFYLGRAYGGVTNYNSAIDAYKKSLEFGGPYSPSWPWYQLAWIYNQRGQYKDAEEAAKNAVKINTTYRAAWSELGFASEKLGKKKQAQEAYTNANIPPIENPPLNLVKKT